MSRLPGCLAALAVAALPVCARAQTPVTATATATPRELTLDEALTLAKRANRSLTVERARLEQARTSIAQAWAALFPTVTAQGKYTRNYKEVDLDLGALFGAPNEPPIVILKQNELDASINATMPLLAPAAYPALEAVKTSVRSSEASYESSEVAVLFSVAQAFYAAAAADEVLVTRRSSVTSIARRSITPRPGSAPGPSPRSTSIAPSWRWCAPSGRCSTGATGRRKRIGRSRRSCRWTRRSRCACRSRPGPP